MQQVKLFFRGIYEIHQICPGLLFFASFQSIINAVSPFFSFYMTAKMINSIASNDPIEIILWYAFITILIIAVCNVASSTFRFFANLRKSSFANLYEMHIAKKTMKLDFCDLEDPQIFEKKQRIQDIRILNGGGIEKILEIFPNLLSSITSLIVSLLIGANLLIPLNYMGDNILIQLVCSIGGSFFLLFLIICSIVLGMYSNATVTKRLHSLLSGFVAFNKVFDYYLNNYISTYHAGKDIRLYNQKDLIYNESTALFNEAKKTFGQIAQNQIKYSSIKTCMSVLVLATIYFFVSLRAVAGFYAIGNIVLYINSINQLVNEINNCVNHIVSLKTNHRPLKEYFDYMDHPSNFKKGDMPFKMDPGMSIEISFHDVSFRYPGTQKYILKNLSFSFQWGKKTAIIGMNGSGKSTIIKLLCRLYNPSEGQITLNGVDIRNICFQDYIALFSIVFQDYKLMALPIGQNIATDREYNQEKVIATLDLSGFSSRLSQMPLGLETPIYKDFDEDGVEVSGGEAQKIALARALYKQSPFFVLDEPTAALDPFAEADIYKMVNGITNNKTTIFISHRLSSCRFCDDILVIKDGQLIQRGTHETLLRDSTGLYRELWDAQAQFYSKM